MCYRLLGSSLNLLRGHLEARSFLTLLAILQLDAQQTTATDANAPAIFDDSRGVDRPSQMDPDEVTDSEFVTRHRAPQEELTTGASR